MSFLLLAVLLSALPLGAMVWLKWRFQPAKLAANADKLLADAEARMEKHDDDALVALVENDAWLDGPVRASKAAGEVREALKKRQFAALHARWTTLWPTLLAADKRKADAQPRALDHIIDIGAALAVLARRHPR
jgi:hypothetical protein